ncbi:MAG TPA: hypothetical protein VFU23_07765 [Gemmatimonadales bacterium]|nr:hypothetical protein [Gemmatimonadales bacterium]
MSPELPEGVDLAIVRVEEPVVGPGERTSVRVHVLNSGMTSARNVTVALADSTESGSAGIAMRHLGDMPPASIKSTTLALTYAITDSIRLGALTVAVFTRTHPDDDGDGVRRSSAWPDKPEPVAVRQVGTIAS